MKNILIGLVLVFLDIDLNFGVGKMDLLPDPIGFLFVLEGFQSLQKKNLIFKNLVEHGTLMAIYSSFLYVFNLFGFYLVVWKKPNTIRFFLFTIFITIFVLSAAH